jgi:glutathione S-transferase
MKVRLLFFAVLRDIAGTDETELDLPDGTTAQAVWESLRSRHPQLGGYAQPPMTAINEEYTSAGAVLRDGDAVIYDSLAIMEYANELDGGALLPADRKVRAQARALLAWQHAGLSGICPRLSFESAFYSERRAMDAGEVEGCQRLFGVFEATLQQSGGPYLFATLSLADLALVPTLVRLLAHGPDLGAWPRSQAWSELLLGRQSVREWMDEARQLPPVLLDDYLPAR